MSQFIRLTARSPVYNLAYLANVKTNEQEIEGSRNTLVSIKESWEILAQYEETGLSPSEVAELAQAKAEGRLIVLPCKVGESYYGVCQENRHIKGKWKTERWVETGTILGFNTVAQLSATEGETEVNQHQRDIDEHSGYWFTGENAKAEAEAALKKIEAIPIGH